jgi:hypothetical protein
MSGEDEADRVCDFAPTLPITNYRSEGQPIFDRDQNQILYLKQRNRQ